jgi:NAD(P)H-nitrite reductase large subunit
LGRWRVRCVVVGNGVAGINAAFAIRARDPGSEITVVSRETSYFYSRTALMYIAMEVMRLVDTEPFERSAYRRERIDLLSGRAKRVDTGGKAVVVEGAGAVPYDRLLLATGSGPAKPNWPGLELDGVCFFVSYQDIENLERVVRSRFDRALAPRAVVIGGGLTGIEACEVLRHAGYTVTFLVRGGHFFHRHLSALEGRYVERHIRSRGVEVMTSTRVERIEGERGRVSAVAVAGGGRMPCDVVVAAGVEPDTGLARESGIPCGKGILVDWTMKTGVGDVWAAGDCVEIVNPGGENFTRAVWYSARDMGRVAGANIAGVGGAAGIEERYAPGEWYDSAKFFDLEYTAAGDVKGEDPADYHYQDGRHSVRVRVRDGAVRGFSMIGARWDHEALLRMVGERLTLERFLSGYHSAIFEPELFPAIRLE